VEHHHIGGGHSIPALSTWFAGRLYVTCCDIKVDSQNLCVYIARRTKNDAIDRTTCWFIIFQYAQDGQYLASWPLRNSFSKAEVVHTWVRLVLVRIGLTDIILPVFLLGMAGTSCQVGDAGQLRFPTSVFFWLVGFHTLTRVSVDTPDGILYQSWPCLPSRFCCNWHSPNQFRIQYAQTF